MGSSPTSATIKMRPDYIVCVLTGYASGPEAKRTWCDKVDMGYTFLDASHAALARRNQERLLVCPECAKAISKVLKS